MDKGEKFERQGEFMRIAVMGDIHGNLTALERCFKEAIWRGADSFIFLGDYTADLPNPREVMDMLYEINKEFPCYFIRGNKEEYWINHRKSSNKDEWSDYNSSSGMLYYTYSQLTGEDIDFYEQLPVSRRLDFEGVPSIIICHGSPFVANENMVRGTKEMQDIVRRTDASYVLCAHTHRQWKYECEGKIVINPGSVGLPIGSDGKTQFAIIEDVDGQWQEELITLSYNRNKVFEDIDEKGLSVHAPAWTALTKRTLKDGKNYHMQALAKAYDLCVQEFGTCNWQSIPEKFWQAAINAV